MASRGVIAQQPLDASRLELLLDAVADYAIYLLDLDGFVASWNKGAEKIKGYSPIEIIGQHFSRLFTPEDQARGLSEHILSIARSDGRHELECWQRRKDGTRFWCNTVIQQVRDEKGILIGFAKITRDITERVAAREALGESERRFRMLVEGVIDYAIYMLDPSGLVVNWNTGATRLKGYSAEEIVGEHFSKFYTKEERKNGLPGRVLETAAREGRYESEGWRIRKDGSRFWASVVVDAIRNERGDLEGFAKVTRDITERRAAQDAIRDSERQFRLLVAGVTDYALFMLDPNGIVTSWNAGAERIKGYTANEIIGQHFSRFYPERDRSAGVPAGALYTAAQEGRFEAEGWRVRKDGSLFWANVIIDQIRDEHDNLIGFAKITRDITERREAQKALEEAQAQRAHAQKMDALGQLTGGVAHDFNNLLMVVGGHIQSIKRHIGDDPKLIRAAEAIELAAQRGATLTRQLLTFSRRQPFRPVVVALRERVDALGSMLARALGNSVKLVATIEPDTWLVKVDPSELELALVNVILNARDAMRGGGVITVTTENVVLSARDTSEKIEGEFVALRINDTGAGIPPDVLPRIFEPFFTTKEVSAGSGLGLSQVYGFAQGSGGAVTVESALGKGTTVSLFLPRSVATGAEVPPAVADAQKAGDGTVLVVEDNPEVSAVTASMLEQVGYKVETVADAEAALTAINARKFDLIVSDIVMAGAKDGLALARAVRDRWPGLPVLLVTGYANVSSEVAREFPMLRKPFDLAELAGAAARLIAQARQPAWSNVIRLRAIRPSEPPGTDRN